MSAKSKSQPAQAQGAQGAEPTLVEGLLLHALIDSVPDQVYARDRQHRHILNNHAQVKLLGARTKEETLGKTDYDFYPAELAASFHRDNERVMSTGEPMINREERIPFADGTVRLLSTTKVPLRSATGEIVGLLGIAHDITELRAAHEKVIEQAAIIDQAHDGIVLLNLEGKLVYINQAAERTFGISGSKALGKRVEEIFPAVTHEPFIRAQQETVRRGSWSGEIRLVRPDGTEVTIENRRSLIRGPDGAPRAQLSISVDITERKRIEALSLRNQRLESIGTLAGGIAHDLNNVLAPILMSIALLRHKTTDAGSQRLITMLEQNAERGAQLVRQVLAFGRGAEGEKVPVQVRHIAREVGRIVGDTFPKSVQFSLAGEPSPWPVNGDATQLHQVLLNLCVNARDAMPNGGSIQVVLENRLIDETFSGMHPGSKPGPYVVASVTDTGTGIPQAIRDRIFEPFFTTKDVGKGTGLGLSTSLGIVQNHGGFIHLTSELGKGSTFAVFLPADPDATAKEAGGEAPVPLPHGNGELILIVDDEDPILIVARSALEKYGYRVLTAANGASAVALFAAQKDSIALVVTDMAMPIMDGPSLAVALRAIKPRIPIIGSSGLDGDTQRANFSKEDFKDFIQKPYTSEILLRAISRAIGRAP